MLPFDRHQEILNLLEKHHSMTVKRLAELLHASEPTLRRDLASLEKQGFVNRVYGGVILTKYTNVHLPLSARKQENKIAKAQIAAQAVKKIRDGSVILLDGSSSSQMMLPHLKHFQKLTIISNSIIICRAAAEMDHKVYCIGGTLYNLDQHNLGSYAEMMIRMMHADQFFFSSSGLSLKGEITGVFEQGVSYLRTAMERADQRIFLCDSTKLNKICAHQLATAADVDDIICDVPLPEEIVRQIGTNRRKQG